MAQGGKPNKNNVNIYKQKSKRKDKIEAHKRKHAPTGDGKDHEKDGSEVSRLFHKKVREHQKKIYKSIEQTIIDKGKHNRERFELL